MTAVPKLTAPIEITWPLLPDDFILPDDPVDNDEQYPLAGALIQALNALPHLLQNALITTNFALCAGVSGRTICKAPDWMYVRPVKPWNASKPRRSYTPHTQGPVPAVVMEFLSETDGGEYSQESSPKIGKWFFYEQIIRVPTYVICEPANQTLEVYQLRSGIYQKQQPDPAGRYWIPGLNLFLGFGEGSRDLRTGLWLRWWTEAGELLHWPEEKAAQAEAHVAQAEEYAMRVEERATQAEKRAAQAEERAVWLAAQLKAAGIEVDEAGDNNTQ